MIQLRKPALPLMTIFIIDPSVYLFTWLTNNNLAYKMQENIKDSLL